MSDEKCFKNEPPFNQCCCMCGYHFEDHSHPTTDGKQITEIKGYACCCFEYKCIVFSGWPKHSMGCELFYEKEETP